MTPISRATDYAVRILSALRASETERVTAAALAQVTSIPTDQVLKVVGPLSRQGWVQSFRGAVGGFALSASLDEVTLLDVVELFEGPLHVQTCTGVAGCEFSARCAAHVIWLEAEQALRRVLAQHTMAEIAARMRALDVFVPRIEARLVQDEPRL